MKRITELELMDDFEQAYAYAKADFHEPHSNFITLFREMFGDNISGSYVLDLGCGPGDITMRFARTYLNVFVHGVDGSDAMLAFGREALHNAPDIQNRLLFIKGRLPDIKLPLPRYDIIISNSLLHHLPDPHILWDTVKRFAAHGAPLFIMDLKRPMNIAEAQKLTDIYTAEEPLILRRDFYNSLQAAFEPEEIKNQLQEASLDYLNVTVVSDRHVVVAGHMKI